jgi:hypothetical protein
VFNGGVAVTSDALEYSKGTETKWYEGYCNNDKANILVGVGIMTGIIATVFFRASEETLRENVIKSVIRNIYDREYEQAGNFNAELNKLIPEVEFWGDERFASFEQIQIKLNELAKTREDIKAGMESITKQAYKESTGLRVLRGLTIGLSIVLILVTVADIAVNVYHLYQYYNREHLPIPKYMVDLSTDRNKETTYITYKSVSDNDGNPGDLNSNSSKEWLALYQTYDERAGAPIVAPESGYVMRVCSDGDYDYERGQSALHLFGIPDSGRTNLTSTEWSYNDKNGKTFFIYSHYDGKIIEEESVAEKNKEEKETVSEASYESVSGNAVDVATPETEVVEAEATQTGTAMSGGVIMLIAVCAMGVVIAFVAVGYSRRKKKG